MNRGRSSDSLDNNDVGVVCSSSGSSSPTDFTSDDDSNTDNIYQMSGQPSANKLRSQNQNSVNKYKMPQRFGDEYARSSHQQRRLHDPPTNRPPLAINHQYRMTNQLDYIDCEPTLHPSTSYFDNEALSSGQISSSNDLYSPEIPDIVPSQSSIVLRPDPIFGSRSVVRDQRVKLHQRGHSSTAIGIEDDENFNFEFDTTESDLFSGHKSALEPSPLAITGPSGRGVNSIVVRMCARFVECRSLSDAIELVAQNRDLIENLTRIVTRDAPAFRNYDIGNYQTDYSVKDSFNPNFWLDREPVVTTADGNCQYHAVSLSLTGSEAYTPEVRLATAVAVIDNHRWFDAMLELIDRGSVLDLVHTIARSYSWGDETTLKAIAVAINRRIFLYTCNIGKKDYEMVKSLSKEELLDAFKEKKYRGGTGIHTYADPLNHVAANNYIMLFHKSEHFIAVLPTTQQPTMFEPYNPIVPIFV